MEDDDCRGESAISRSDLRRGVPHDKSDTLEIFEQGAGRTCDIETRTKNGTNSLLRAGLEHRKWLGDWL